MRHHQEEAIKFNQSALTFKLENNKTPTSENRREDLLCNLKVGALEHLMHKIYEICACKKLHKNSS